MHARERVFPFHASYRLAKRLVEAGSLSHEQRHEQREAFGIGLRDLRQSVCRKLVPELAEVLEDAVVDDGDLAVRALVRVRVLFGGTPVSRPARVADSYARAERVAVQSRSEEHTSELQS